MGFGSREMFRKVSAPINTVSAWVAASGGRMIPAPAGGVLIRDAAGEIIGAVGVTGDTADNDESCAVHGIVSAGLVPDTGEDGWNV